MRRLRAGVIGLGVGERHLEAYLAHPACESVIVCDLNPDRLREVAARHPEVRTAPGAEAILDDPDLDLVSIASYDNFHHAQVVRALEGGKHVFVEKPLCLSAPEAKDIRDRLRRRPELLLSSNLNLRTCPRFIRVREAVRSGEMGRVYFVEADYLWGRSHKLTDGWRRDMPFYSIILGAAVHMIDLVVWITGGRPRTVRGLGSRIATAGSGFRYNDFAALLLDFDDGMTAQVTAHGGCVHPHFHRLHVYGTARTFVHDLTGAAWLESSDPAAAPAPVVEEYPGRRQRALSLNSFVDSILDENVRPSVTADEVFEVMSICFAAERAVQSGGALSIDYL